MDKILTLARKDLALLIRDKVGFFFTFFFPVIYASLFGLIFASFGGEDSMEIRIAVIDEDDTPESRAFIERLEKAEEVQVVRDIRSEAQATRMNREQAADLVRKGRLPAYVVLEEGFGESAAMPFGGGEAKIKTGIDPARRAESGMLQGILTRHYFRGTQEIFSDEEKMSAFVDESLADIADAEDMNPVTKAALQTFLPSLKDFMKTLPEGSENFASFEPIAMESVEQEEKKGQPKTGFDITFPQGIVWGIMGCAAAFGISLVVERSNGTLTRLRIAPLHLYHILGGKAVACFLTVCGVATLLLIFARLVFGVTPDSPLLLALAVVCSALCFTGIMMLLSVLGKTEQSAGGIGWACLMILAMLGGGMIPLFFMPGWMQSLSDISPIKWSILAMEGAIFRGFSIGEMAVPCLILVGVGLVSFVIGGSAFSRMERR